MAINGIRGILFDLDDTLIPSEALYAAGLRAAHARLRRDRKISRPAFHRLYAQARENIKARLGRAPAARNRVLYFKEFVELLCGESRPRLTLALWSAYNTAWRDIDATEVRSAIAPLARHFKLGILTNQTALMQLQKMERIDPRGDIFKVLITAEEVGVEKPDARAYRTACRTLGTTPAQTLLVGDSWTADVVGGLQAGLRVAFFSPRPPPAKLPAGCVHIRSLRELRPLLVMVKREARVSVDRL